MSNQTENRWFQPTAFDAFPEVVAIHSLRDTSQPGGFSMLYATDEQTLAANRVALAAAAGFPAERLAFPRLEHGDTVVEVTSDYDTTSRPVADALITNRPGWLIGAAVADCIVVLLYDPTHHAIAAIHSGWRGSAKNIVGKTVQTLADRYDSTPADLIAYLSPAPTADEYEVGHEVSEQFGPKYSTRKSDTKDWFDNKLVVHDQLLAAGVAANHIASDPRSTMADTHFHSYRRDSKASGRMIVAIGIRKTDA
ncbi:MAG TPA: peptidoglycan editing factor PgeF [Candidatus Saccharimonadales bacterium]|nr:peptidoglycan editing factor PgeF [Candidatus Saccharimonadales bacterium]